MVLLHSIVLSIRQLLSCGVFGSTHWLNAWTVFLGAGDYGLAAHNLPEDLSICTV